MKKGLLIVCIFFLLVFSCTNGCIEQIFKEGTGTIVYNDFEGGFYGIIADEGFGFFRNLDPINLPDELKEEDLRVRFKVRMLYGQVSFHMWGILVKILDIEKIE